MQGLETADRLPEPIPIDPGDYSAEERAELGILPLPSSLEEALAQFTADPVLTAALGRLGEVFTAVRRAELATLAEQSFAQERALLLERY